MNTMNTYNQNKLVEEYFQWAEDTDRAKYELTEVYVKDNDEYKTVKKMAWVIKTSPEDWKEFCKATGRECEGEMQLLALY